MPALSRRLHTLPTCLLAALLLLGCGESTRQRVLHYAGPDSAVKARFQVLAGDSLVRHGRYEELYPDSTLKLVLDYKHGRPWTLLRQQTPAGEDRNLSSLQKGTGKLQYYDTTGQLRSVTHYRAGVPQGKLHLYADGGQEAATLDLAGGLAVGGRAGEDELGGLQQGAELGLDTTGLPAEGGSDPDAAIKSGLATAGQVLKHFQQKNFAAIAKLRSSRHSRVSRGMFLKYVRFLSSLYGDLTTYKRLRYGLNSDERLGEVLQVAFLSKFQFTQAATLLSLARVDGRFRVVNLSVQAEAYTPIMELKRIGDPVMDQLASGNVQAIYDNAGELLRQRTSLENFQQLAQQIEEQGGFQEYSLFQHSVSVLKGQLAALLMYEIELGGEAVIVELSTLQSDGQFELVGLSIVPKQQRGGAGQGGTAPGRGPGARPMP